MSTVLRNGPPETKWRDVSEDKSKDLNEEGFPIVFQNQRIQSVDINFFHDQQGHQSEQLLQLTAQMYGIKLTGKPTSCEGCALSKAKQKDVAKKTQSVAEEAGHRLFLDASGPFEGGLKGKKYYAAAVDDATGMGFAGFFDSKTACAKWYIESIIDPLIAKGFHN